MASLLGELQRRNVFRVAVAYVVVGWIVIQVAETLAPLLLLPEWTPTLALFIGIIGFPFALFFAWAFELTPDGLRRSEEVDPDESVTHVTAGHINRVITVLLVIVLAILLAERQWSGRSMLDATAPSAVDGTTEGAVDETPATAADAAAPRSIAVLPFVNMSADPEQEYFSDGISEELLNALARIGELRVAARTSSFAFKGQNQDITNIGKQLKVETVLEGSVRKSGQRVRITAQLINVADGYHLWSDTYDRDLTDIFAIQDEISAAIVAALRVHLTDTPREQRPVDLQAYNLMLQARENVRSRNREALELAQLQFQQAIDIQPDYALAWAGKALATNLLSVNHYGDTAAPETAALTQQLVDRALSLEPNLGLAHAVQGLLHYDTNRYQDSAASLAKAIAASPSEAIFYAWQANTLANIGEETRRIRILEQAYSIDPLHPVVRFNLAMVYVFQGEDDKALAMTTPGSAMHHVVKMFAAMTRGEFAEAYEHIDHATRAPGAELGNAVFFKDFITFVTLAEPLPPRENRPADWATFLNFSRDPEGACASLDSSSVDPNDDQNMTTLANCLSWAGRWPELLQALAPRRFDTMDLYGDFTIPGNGIWLAWYQAWALLEMGDTQASRELVDRIIAFVDNAVANGAPEYQHQLLARCHLLLGEHDEAVRLLEEGWTNFGINWREMAGHWWQPLAVREDFQQLKARILAHADSERAKLGWPPASFDP